MALITSLGPDLAIADAMAAILVQLMKATLSRIPKLPRRTLFRNLDHFVRQVLTVYSDHNADTCKIRWLCLFTLGEASFESR